MSQALSLTGAASASPGAVTASPVPVLIVDDNPSKRLGLKAILSPLGYSIVEAETGVAALRCVTAQDFAVILLDVRMPVMDGFETAAYIRQRPQSESTPIIFITAHGKNEVIEGLYAAGAVDFIFAPVDADELRAKVAAFGNLFIKTQFLAARAGEVQATADQLRLLTEAAPIGIFQTDADNRYVYTNPRWTEITGFEAAEAKGRYWADIIGPAERFKLRTESTAGDQKPAELSQRFKLSKPAEAPRVVMVTSRPIPDHEGRITGWVGTLADITAEAGAELALGEARDNANEATRLKSDFLARMSHEIRTPMNGVIGMTELLLESDLDAVQRDYVETVHDSGEALLTVINNILDFSKIEAGVFELDTADFSPWAVADDAIALLKGLAEEKGIDLLATVHSSVPALVNGDPGRVRQVLINLIGNAIKFTQAGEIAVRITQEAGGADTLIRFEVEDTGAGIPPDQLSLIFQPYVQVGASGYQGFGGTGLGLAISGQLVSLMGGECGVTSQPGVGSTFWFTVRAQSEVGPGTTPVDLTPIDVRNPPPLLLADPAAGHRLLLAEDNLINQKVALAMLADTGYRVDTVLTGAAAVRAVAEFPYDAVLMDCQMPELDGFEATAAIRAQEEGSNRHTPIIAMTAGALQDDRERCITAGMDGYLAKPVRKDALLALVTRSVENARP